MYPQLSLESKLQVTPQMVIASNLLRLSAVDVEQMLSRELAENPALEMVESSPPPRAPRLSAGASHPGRPAGAERGSRPASRVRSNDKGDGEPDDPFDRLASRESVADQLLGQAGLYLSGRDLEIAAYLLQCLDQHGFLDAPPAQFARELGAEPAEVERVIRSLQELHPPGIAARDTRECFLIQCRQLAADGLECELVCRILERAWKDFVNQRWDCVARKLGVTNRVVEQAWQFMRQNLYPYPLHMLAEPGGRIETLTRADLIVLREPGRGGNPFRLEIPDAEAFELRVSPTFQLALQGEPNGGERLEAGQREWLNDSVSRARMIIAALAQRWATLRRIGEFLVDYQEPFLNGGPRQLRQLTRAELANELGLHESTISRAIADKTLQLPNGRIIPLADLFDNSLSAKEAIRQLLARTDEPLSDREIALRLRAEGLILARRTVTKYREALGIPTRQQRRRTARLKQKGPARAA